MHHHHLLHVIVTLLPHRHGHGHGGQQQAAEARHVRRPHRLDQELLGAFLEAPPDPGRRVLGRHDHHRDLAELRRLLHPLQQLVPSHLRHAVVRDDHVHLPLQAENLQCSLATVHRRNLVFGAAEEPGDDGTVNEAVVHGQDVQLRPRRHWT